MKYDDYLNHGLLKIRPDMTQTDFGKCMFGLFVGSNSDIIYLYSHILSYTRVLSWFEKRKGVYGPPAFFTKGPKYHALINLTDSFFSGWYFIMKHISLWISVIFLPTLLQILPWEEMCHFSLVPWYLEIRMVLHI